MIIRSSKPKIKVNLDRQFVSALVNRCFQTFAWFLLFLATAGISEAQTTGVINYQGRVMVGDTLFKGTGLLKFALVNADASKTFWRNSSVSAGSSEPAAPVSVQVAAGLYNVALGDTAIPNMATLPSTVFAEAVSQTTANPIFLRVWFNDGINGFQLLTPDTRVTPVAFAMAASFAQTAATVADGSITAVKLAPGVIPSGITAVSDLQNDESLINSGYKSFHSIAAPGWTGGSTLNQPAARSAHNGIWTGSEFFVWGGKDQSSAILNDGGLYDPKNKTWTYIPYSALITGRSGHSMVWTGQRTIVWGGMDANGTTRTGALYEPKSRIWSSITSKTGAPSARLNHVAVLNGDQMFIWGGRGGFGNFLKDTAFYNHKTDTWSTPILTGTLPNAAAKAGVIWTGSEYIVFGGLGVNNVRVASALNADKGYWRSLSTVSIPSPRQMHGMIWTGTKMLVWGGENSSGVLGDGAAYDPSIDQWTPISTIDAPSARTEHATIWTGKDMLVIGGSSKINNTDPLSSSFAYNPANNTWRTLSTNGTPIDRGGGIAVWAPPEALIFGGLTLPPLAKGGTAVTPIATASLQSLEPIAGWFFYRHP